jgi:hypothetical protein
VQTDHQVNRTVYIDDPIPKPPSAATKAFVRNLDSSSVQQHMKWDSQSLNSQRTNSDMFVLRFYLFFIIFLLFIVFLKQIRQEIYIVNIIQMMIQSINLMLFENQPLINKKVEEQVLIHHLLPNDNKQVRQLKDFR